MKRRMLSLIVTVAMVLGLAVTMAFAQDGAETEAVASVGDQTYTTLQNAVDKANGQTITLLQDVVLTSAVQVPAAAVTIEGKGNTITLAQGAAASCAVFNNTTSSPEGLLAGTDLTVNEVNFVSEIGGQAGHAVIVGSQGDVDVSLDGCTFTGLYDAVYCNWVGNADAKLTSISITDSTFTNVAHSYGVDDGATPGGRVDKHTFTLDGNINEPAPETFAVASVDGVGYISLEDAMDAVSEAQDKTVTLRKDVELSSMLVINQSMTLDLGGNTITAGADFTGTFDNDKHLVEVNGASDVVLRNGRLETTTANKHALNVYGAENFLLENVVVDHTLAEKGAPVVVNGSTMSVGGTVELITGEKSWYAMNVDNQVNGVATASEVTFVEGANVKFSGVNPLGIYLETAHAGTQVAVSFEKNVKLSSDVENFVAVSTSKTANGAVVNDPENAGLDTDKDGNLVPHEHVFGDAWVSDETGHWHACACGEKQNVAQHTFQWVVDKEATATENGSKHEECTVCGYAKQAVVIPATGATQPSEQPSQQPSEQPSQQPSEQPSQQPSQTQKPDAEQPQTGDVSNVALWVAMMFVSVAILTGVMAYTKKRA